jgi:hypothetical protein
MFSTTVDGKSGGVEIECFADSENCGIHPFHLTRQTFVGCFAGVRIIVGTVKAKNTACINTSRDGKLVPVGIKSLDLRTVEST